MYYIKGTSCYAIYYILPTRVRNHLLLLLFMDSSIAQTKTDMIKVIASKPFIDTLLHQLLSFHDVC